MLKPLSDLQRTLISIDGDQYVNYKEIRGEYETANLRIAIDHIQNDPFAASTRIRVMVNQNKAKFPEYFLSSDDTKLAVRDYLARQLFYEVAKFSRQRGTGKSGEIYIPEPGQEILGRSSVQFIDDKYWEARFFVGLPASGKHIIGHIAVDMLCQDLTRIAEKCMFYDSLNQRLLKKHVDYFVDTQYIRSWLSENNAIAFIAENAIVPRKPQSQKPDNSAVPFTCADDLYSKIQLPNRGEIRGLAIPTGISVITGPAFSGKSTLLNALQKGIYNHIPGDGRGYIITRKDTVKIVAEPDRNYASVDLSNFNVPTSFTKPKVELVPDTLRAKISQMVNISEALELGCRTLVFDENDITPEFIYSDNNHFENSERSLTDLLADFKVSDISAIIVSRAIPALLNRADQIYITDKEFALKKADIQLSEDKLPEGKSIDIAHRSPNARTITPKRGNKSVLIASRGTEALIFGNLDIDVSYLNNLVEQGQLDAIGQSINYARKNLMGEKYALKNIASRVESDVNKLGWDAIDSRKMGIYVEFRPIDFAMILNRIPDLEILD